MKNPDLDLDKLFQHRETKQWARFNEMQQEPLNRQIYFSPSKSPLVSWNDYQLGSCFRDWVIPTPEVVGNKIDLAEYQSWTHSRIREDIEAIYRHHSRAVLCLSGGVDSVCILSFLLDLKLISRTQIVIFGNLTQTDPSCLHLSDCKEKNLSQILSKLDCYSIERYNFDLSDMTRAISDGLDSFKCYTTHAIMQRYRNQAIILGTYGNYLLLHSDACLDEIRLRQPGIEAQIKQRQSEKNFYTISLTDYHLESIPAPLSRRHLMLKPWAALQGRNGNTLYHPIANPETFNRFRRVDFGSIDFNIIFDATIVKSMIIDNNQSWLLDFVSTEGIKDFDNLQETNIPIHLLQPTDLQIPMELVHDADGLNWLNDQIHQSLQQGYIPINSLTSIKNLQYIRDQINISSNATIQVTSDQIDA